MSISRKLLSCLSFFVPAILLAFVMLVLNEPVGSLARGTEVHEQVVGATTLDYVDAANPSAGRYSMATEDQGVSCASVDQAGAPLSTLGHAGMDQPLFRIQATNVPTYYLDNDVYEVHIDHPQGNYWASGCFEAWTEAELSAVVFRTTKTGTCGILKRMSSSANCSGSNLWSNTSDSLSNEGYYCTGGAAACQAVAPEATHLSHTNMPKPSDTQVRGGFQLGWSCAGEATVYDIHFIYYGVPPYLPDDQVNAPCDCPVGCANQTTNWVGGPINTRSGNYHYSRQDISVAAQGGDLRFERSYNSLETDLYLARLGPGWTHNYDMDLTFPDDPGGEQDTVIVKGCHGSRFRFADDGGDTLDPYPGVWAELTRTVETSPIYFLRGVDQSTYVFSSTGELVEILSPQGQTTSLSYVNDQLVRVEGPTGQRFLDFAYDGQNHLASVTDHTGRSVGYGYDVGGDLTVVTDTRGFAWTYTYTGTHLLRDVRDPLGHVVERTEYDAEDRAIRQWDGLLGQPLQIDYGVDGGTIITDPLGHESVDGYYGYGLLISQQTEAGTTCRSFDDNFNWTSTTDGNGNTTDFAFNPMGLPEQITDARGHVTQMEYDALNHLVAITNALSSAARYEYDGNRLTTVTDALGGTVSKTYDDRGLLIQVVDHGVTTSYGYNALGQLTAITDTMGHVTTHGYDTVGRLITTTAPGGQVTINAYDAGDSLVRTIQNYSPALSQNYQNTYNLITEYGYDATGNRTHVTDTLGYVTRNWYDEANRLVSVTVNYSPTVGPNHDSQWNLTTQYGYDAVGNQTHVTDTVGRVARNWYDRANRLVRTTANYSPTVGPNHDGQWNLTTRYTYDAVGNQTAITDTEGRVTRNGYDDLNRLVSTTVNYSPTVGPNYESQWNVTTRYAYDALGQRTATTNTLGHATHHTYDALGRLTATIDPLGNTTTYGYDALGHQTGITDPTGITTTSSYDGLGRRVETRDALGNATTYAYDAKGRLEATTNPLGVTAWREYDAAGRLSAVVENYRAGRTPDHQTNVRAAYGYDALSRRTVVTDANGHVTYQAYDAAGRLARETDPLGHTTEYSYNALGLRTVITDAADGSSGGEVTTFFYDARGRLIEVRYPDATVEHAYDSLGNRVAMTDSTGTTVYVYDALNRLITVTSPTTGTVGYRYDPLGNRTQVIYPDGESVTTTYDAANRLERVESEGEGATTYSYDGAGRTLERVLPNGITTTHSYDDAGRPVGLRHEGPYWTLAAYTYTLDAAGNRVKVVEHVLGPNPPVYLPLVMRDYSGDGERAASGDEGGDRSTEPLPDPFRSPLPKPAPTPKPLPGRRPRPFDSPLPPEDKPKEGSAAPKETSLLWPGLSLLVVAPLAAVAFTQRRKGGRWVMPLVGALLAVGVVATGTALAEGRASSGAALNGPVSGEIGESGTLLGPFLSPSEPTVGGDDPACNYPLADEGERATNYTYNPLGRLVEAADSNGECYQYAYDEVGNRTTMIEALASPVPTGPDLVVTDIALNPAVPEAGQPATVCVTVENRGTQAVESGNNFYVDFYIDQEPGETSDLAWGAQGAWFDVGQSHAFCDSYTFAGGGTYQLYAQADTDDTVVERYEGNNVLGPVMQEVAGGRGRSTGSTGATGSTDVLVDRSSSGGEQPRPTPTPIPLGRAPGNPKLAASRFASSQYATEGAVVFTTTTYTYDPANRLTARQVSDGRAYTYTWSARGQMLAEWTQGVAVRTFEYDGAGRLSEATVFTLTTRFTYNGVGDRVAVEVVGHGTTAVTPDYAAGSRILAETTLTGATQYLYGRDCLGQQDGDGWLYYLNDGSGYVRQGTNEQGFIESAWRFDPDGMVVEGPQGPVSHLVCGGVYDWSTGLVYKHGNYFDPSLGIWLALAPLVVVQSLRRRKKGCRFPWMLLVGLFLVGTGAMLAGCGGGDQPTIVCTEVPTPTWVPTITPLPPTWTPPPLNTPTPTNTPISMYIPSELNLSQAGFDFIVGEEWVVLHLYNDNDDLARANCTVGVGHLVHEGQCDGGSAEQEFVGGITEERAYELFRSDLQEREAQVQALVTVPLTQYQYDALVSFVFNAGSGRFQSSDTLIFLNQGNYTAAADAIGREFTGGASSVAERRRKESEMFRYGTYLTKEPVVIP